MNCNKPEIHPASKFLHTVEDCKLDQLVNESTHLKPKCKPSLIDLIITNNKDLSTNPSLQPPLGKSHHSIIYNKIIFDNNATVQAAKIKKFQTSKGNYTEINKELKEVNWEKEFEDIDYNVDKVWNFISTKIKDLRDKHIPTIYITSQ